MARMIPGISVGSGAVGERRLYLYLEHGLGDDFTVLHRLPFLQDEGRRLYDHEIDFLLLHRRLGLLVIEVKGGTGIEYDPETRVWTSTDHAGKRHRLAKDPFEQARSNIYGLVDEIARRRVLGAAVTSRHDLPFAYSYAVAFPDLELEPDALPPHVSRDIVIDFTDLGRLEEKVASIMRRRAGTESRGMDETQFKALLYGYLARRFKVTCPLYRKLEDEAASFKRLTEEQCEHLNFLEGHRRALIMGYAGTGKTQMAMEKARWLAREGLDVLFLCYNRALARDLERARQEPWGNIDIDNYHSLCRKAVEAAGLDFVAMIPEEADEAERFWVERAPALLEEHAASFPKRYDAVIIDEGQDFRRGWFDGIMRLLRDREQGYLYIFYDENQNLFGGELEFPIDGPPLRLFQNCRNTREICSMVAEVGAISEKHYRAKDNPVGEPVRFFSYREPREQVGIIEDIIARLLEEGVFPNMIAVLSPRRRENSCLAGVEELAGCPVVDFDPDEPEDAVTFSTVKRFKGLEKSAVIFCDIDADLIAKSPGEAYTAMSRAQHLLFVVHHESWVPPGARD